MNNYMKKYNICIVAQNIAGLGSINVVSNILLELSNNRKFSNFTVYVTLPKIPFWESYQNQLNTKWVINWVFRSNNKLFRFLFRAYDLILGHMFLPKSDIFIVLGDFPLRVKAKQVLLLHNPHIVDNKKSIFSFHRFFFNYNHKYVSLCFVQTDIMKFKLLNFYPYFNNKVISLKMPAKNIFNFSKNYVNNSNILYLFYPASSYVHKNHEIICKLFENHSNDLNNVNFILTINEFNRNMNHNNFFKNIQNIKFLGELNEKDVHYQYSQCDALFFPSINETYGLPLIEAMKMGKYILCSDLQYAKELCLDQAIYFDPLDEISVLKAIETLRNRKISNNLPNWSEALSKIPENWKIYSDLFVNFLEI